MAEKIILKKLPDFSMKEKGERNDLVAVITGSSHTDISSPHGRVPPSEAYVGMLVGEYTFTKDKRIDNALKFRWNGSAYEVTLVDTLTTQNPTWPLTKEGIAYLKKKLPDYFKT